LTVTLRPTVNSTDGRSARPDREAREIAKHGINLQWIESDTVSESINQATGGVLYRLDASIRVEGSHSRALADLVEQEWRTAYPEEPIVRRHIGVDPIPATAWATAVFASRTPEESRSDEQNAALALAATLTDELVSADALLFAVPLYNFGVSQHFKTWVDMVIADPRMAADAEPILAGKPAVLVTARGGSYRPGTPREGWDHATGWMQRILADVWQLDLKTVEAEFTLVGVNPALDQFKDLARRLRSKAEEKAIRAGRELGAAVASAAAVRTADPVRSPRPDRKAA
jgi:FMN-dependent NADH-azoreductase